MSVFDLAIIGGGPAGSAAALEASRSGLRVCLWERDRFPRDKVCGEFLSPEAIPAVAGEIPEVFARASCIARVEWISRRGEIRALELPAHAAGISRRLLDEALWRKAAASTEAAQEGSAVVQVARNPHQAGWTIRTAGGDEAAVRAVILACGRWWAIDGMASPARGRRARTTDWLGVKAHFRGVEGRDSVEMYFFPGGYCGLAPIEDGLYNACCLVSSKLATEFRGITDMRGWLGQVSRHEALACRFDHAQQVSRTIATAPIHLARGPSDSDGVLFAGDAAGFLDPFTGAGISMAIHAGRLAARTVAASLGSSESASIMARCYRQALDDSAARSYLVANVLRWLVRAPEPLQARAAGLVAPIAPWLLRATRWTAAVSEQGARGLA